MVHTIQKINANRMWLYLRISARLNRIFRDRTMERERERARDGKKRARHTREQLEKAMKYDQTQSGNCL